MKIFQKHWPLIILILIVVGGAFLRFWQIGEVPPGLYPDEAKNGNDVLVSLQTGTYPLFYPENNGREGLFLWLIALAFQWFGVSVASLKLPSAIIGTLTIIAVYALTKEFFLYAQRDVNARVRLQFSHFAVNAAALLSSGFVAFSFWHINFSRIAFRAIFVPLLLSAALAFTFHALRTRNILSIIASAFLWGIGYYTYIAFRVSFVIPMFVITATFIIYLIQNPPFKTPGWWKRMYITDGWWKWDVWGVVFLATIAPIAHFFITTPGTFSSRSGGISVFDSEQPIQALLSSIGLHLQMFFVMGDNNWRHNVAGEAQLLWPIAILFAFGIGYALWTTYEGVRYRNYSLVIAQCALAGWFVTLLSPAFLTTESVPHALRAIGVIPVVYLYATFGFLFLVRLLFPHRYHRGSVWPFGIVACAMALLALASFQFNHYFITWGKNPVVADAFSAPYVAMGEYINNLEYGTHAYLIENVGGVAVTYPATVRDGGDPLLAMSAQTTIFIQQTSARGLTNSHYLAFHELPFALQTPAVLIPLSATETVKQTIRANYPQGEELRDSSFWGWRVPR